MRIEKIHFNIKNGIGYGLMMVFCAVPAIFVNTIYGYLPFIVLLLSLILSTAYVAVVWRTLSIQTESGNISCRRNEKVAFEVTVINKGFLPVPTASIAFFRSDSGFQREFVQETELFIAPGQHKDYRFQIVFDHIGVYRAGVRDLSISDFLGLIRISFLPDITANVCVSPGMIMIEELNLSHSASTESNKAAVASRSESMDYAGVREYRFGDPIKSIHWKLSAHTREYMTRQNESYSNPGTTVFADFRFQCPDSELWMTLADAVSETAAASAYDCFSKGIDCEIMYKGLHGYRSFMPERFDDFSHWVADLPFRNAEEEEREEKIRQLQGLQAGYRFSNIVYCTADPDEKILSLLAGFQQNGKQIIVILILPEELYDDDYDLAVAPLKVLNLARAQYRIVRAGTQKMRGE